MCDIMITNSSFTNESKGPHMYVKMNFTGKINIFACGTDKIQLLAARETNVELEPYHT